MSRCIRPRIEGATVFFTVALAVRGGTALVDHVGALRISMFAATAGPPLRFSDDIPAARCRQGIVTDISRPVLDRRKLRKDLRMTSALKTAIIATVLTASATSAVAFTSNGPTIQRALSGNSVVGQMYDGISYCEYHAPNGGIFGRDTEVYAGNWTVWNNHICYTYPGYGEDCQRASVRGSMVTFTDSLNGGMISSGTIVGGNVCN